MGNGWFRAAAIVKTYVEYGRYEKWPYKVHDWCLLSHVFESPNILSHPENNLIISDK
jgi:hypothetical protein